MTKPSERQPIEDLKRQVDSICRGQGSFFDATEMHDFRSFTPAPPDTRLHDAGPVRAPAERVAFGRWLFSQAERGGLIGELANCAKADRGFPAKGDPEAVREHLRRMMADGDMFAAVDEAELDWACY